MINNVTLMGRITHDLKLESTSNGKSALSFSLAVDRDYTDSNGERPTDFIRCTAYGATAEFIENYFFKGRMIAVMGQLRTHDYEDKHRVKHYVTEILITSASFTGEPRAEEVKPADSGKSNTRKYK